MAGAQLQLPAPSVVAVQRMSRPSVTVIVLLASAVPLKVGVLSLVALAAAGLLIDGAAGATVSTVKVRLGAAELTLPVASAAFADMVWLLSLSGVVGVQLQLPAPSAVALQRVVKPSVTVIVLPASAVPLKVGVLSLVMLAAAGLLIAGEAGAVVSTWKVRSGAAAPVLPAVSVAVAEMVWLPSIRAMLGAQLQLPAPSAVTLQSVSWPSVTVMVLPASAVPLKLGVLSPVVLAAIGLVMLGAAGAVVSTVKVCTSGALVLLTESVAITFRPTVPVASPPAGNVPLVGVAVAVSTLHSPLASTVAV